MKNEERLRQILAACPPPPADPAARQETIRRLRETPPGTSAGGAGFLLAQAGFIRKRMWGLQLAFLAGVLLTVQAELRIPEQEFQLYWKLSAAMPLLILINVTDWVRIYNGGMVEIELATRFSLPRVTAARLLIFGLSDGVLVLAIAAFAASAAQASLLRMLLYCLVPFDLMCLGCLALLRRVKPDYFTLAAAVLAAVLAALPAVGREIMYQRLDFRLWAAAALVLTLALPWQIGRALQDLRPGRHSLALARS